MKTLKSLLVLILISLTSISIEAQNTIKPDQKCACCEAPFKKFDFWEGKWIVKDTLGNKLGENIIEKIESGCVLQEHWKGEKGGTGTSINYYNKIDSTWNQTWVSSSGNILKLKGKFTEGKMVLKSTLVNGQQGQYYNLISWIPNGDGTVTQVWDILNKDGIKIQNVFKGIYHRVK